MPQSSQTPAPQKPAFLVGDSISPLTIVDLTVEGGAIARHEGQVVFLDSGAPEAVVSARVEKCDKKIIHATVTEVLQPSPYDTSPWCPLFGECGGCSWQHITQEAQQAWKEKRIGDTLTRLGGLDVAVEPLVTGSQKDFRTRMTYAFGYADGKNVIGLRKRNSQEVVPLTLCGLQSAATPVLDKVQTFLNNHPEMPVWANKDGYWRFLTIHTPLLPHPRTQKPQIVVEFIVGSAPQKMHAELQRLIEEMLSLEVISGAIISEKRVNDSLAFGEKILFQTEEVELYESYGTSQPFIFSPQAFMQTNTAVFSQLLTKACNSVPQSALSNIWDLYCGSGVIGQYLVQKNQSCSTSRIFGVDSEAKAIKYAKHNARELNGELARYTTGKIENTLSKAPFSPTLIILDPPRSGVNKMVIDMIQQSGASHILYISCDVGTQARDIKRLGEGWQCSSAASFDMFPATPHIENIVVLTRVTQGE